MKYKQYQKMKDSGVEWIGEIPEHWEEPSISILKQMNVIIDFQDGNHGELHPKGDDFSSEGRPFLTANQIDEFGKVDLKNCNKLPEEFCKKLRIGFSQANDVLFCHNATVGRVGIMPNDAPNSIVGTSITYYRIDNDKLGRRFFAYLLRSDYISSQYEPIMKQSTRNQFSIQKQAKLRILFPTKEESKQISDFLDIQTAQFDELISKSQSQINFLQEKRQALINHAVTKGLDPNVPMKDSGVEWIGEIPEHWEVQRLKQITKFSLGLVINPSHYFDENGKIPMITGKNVKPAGLDLSDTDLITEESNFQLKDSQIFSDDIVSMRVGYAGRSAVVSSSAHGINCASLIITRGSKNHNSHFICYILNSPVGRAQTMMSQNGMAQQVVNLSSWKNFIVPLPEKHEQNQISEFLDKQTAQFDDLISKSQSQIDFLHEKRQALITAAVTGKIDVRNGVAA